LMWIPILLVNNKKNDPIEIEDESNQVKGHQQVRARENKWLEIIVKG